MLKKKKKGGGGENIKKKILKGSNIGSCPQVPVHQVRSKSKDLKAK